MPENENTIVVIPVKRTWLFCNVTAGVVNTIVTHNLATGWDDFERRKNELEIAVEKLVERNPILSGALRRDGIDETGKKVTSQGLFVDTGKYDKLVHYYDAPKGIPSPAKYHDSKKQTADYMWYIQNFIEPSIPGPVNGKDEIQKGLPVFGLHIMKLPDGYIYYSPQMSHVIGDGTTYYMVIQELNDILNKKKKPAAQTKIVWDSKVGQTFDFTHQSRDPFFIFAMIFSVIVYAIFGRPPMNYVLLSKDKINKKKKELAKVGGYLSTNDIVTAAICQGLGTKTYSNFNQAVSFRGGRWPGIENHYGGNLSRLASLSVQIGCNPNEVRTLSDTIKQRAYDNMPFWSTCTGRFFNQANWATISHVLDGTIFHSPTKSFLDENPVPQVVIYDPNENEIGIMHTLKGLNTTEEGLLKDLLV